MLQSSLYTNILLINVHHTYEWHASIYIKLSYPVLLNDFKGTVNLKLQDQLGFSNLQEYFVSLL